MTDKAHVAEKYEFIALSQRNAIINDVSTTLTQKMDLIKDLTIFSTALLASIVAAIATKESLVQNKGLLMVGAVSIFISLILCFYSRYEYSMLYSTLMTEAEDRYAEDLKAAQDIRYGISNDQGQRISVPFDRSRMSPENTNVIMDVKLAGKLIILGIALSFLSFT